MARLPRYTRMGVEAAAPTRVDYSPIAREGAALGNAIASGVEQMREFVYKQQAQKAARQGQEAVREQGALPILEKLQAQGGPGISIAEQAAYETAHTVAQTEIQVTAEQTIRDILRTAEQNVTPFSAVTQQLEDAVDGFSASLSMLNPEAAGVLQARLSGAANDASVRYADFYQRKMEAQRAERLNNTATGYSDDAMAEALRPGADATTLAAFVDERAASLVSAGVTAERAQAWRDQTYSAAVKENNLYRSATMPLNELKAEVETMPTEPLPGMTYGETLTEYNRVSSMYNTRLSVAEADLRLQQDRVDTAYQVLANGGVIGPQQMTDIAAGAAAIADIFPEAQTQADQFVYDLAFMESHQGMNLDQLRVSYEASLLGVPGLGESGIDTLKEISRRDFIAKLIVERETAQAQSDAADVETARPIFDRIDTASGVLDTELAKAVPNPVIVELAMSELNTAAESLPASVVTDNLQEKLAEIRTIQQDLETWRNSQPEELRSELDRLRSGIVDRSQLQPGMDVLDQVAMNQRRATLLEGLISSQQEAFLNGDGLQYANTSGFKIPDGEGGLRLVGQPIDVSLALTDPERFNASVDNRFKELAYVQEHYQTSGQDVLLPQEKQAMEQFITTAEPGAVAAFLGSISNLGDNRALEILTSLDMQDSRIASTVQIASLSGTGNQQAAALALRGLETDKPSSLRDADFNASWIANTGNVFQNLPNTANGIRETAKLIYTGMAQRDANLAERYDPSAMSQAIKMALGSNTIDEINGQFVMLEPGIDAGVLTEFLANPFDVPGAVVNADQLGDYSFDALANRDFYPVAVAPGQYLMAVGTGMEQRFWTDSEDRPVIVNLGPIYTSQFVNKPFGG